MKFNFPDFRKRTEKEVMDSVDKKDYTGGYTFFPWVLYMRTYYLVAALLNMFFGHAMWGAYKTYGYETATLVFSLFFGIGVPSLIVFLLIREYKEKKKGISK